MQFNVSMQLLSLKPVSRCISFCLSFACVGMPGAMHADQGATSRYLIAESMDIAEVPADFPVGYCLLTTSSAQYVAYYDRERRMTVASRALDSAQWRYQTLPSKVGWDSHNYITMTLDTGGHLHVSGNMHCDELVYFRTEKPGDVTSLKSAAMTGALENRVTYPAFLTDHQGRLVFTYRHGGSGNGINLYNVYDPGTRTWKRLLDQALFDGEGQCNAYPNGPVRGPDGWFHVTWLWRDTPDCATNHHLSYARSPDLLRWESAFGEKVGLPIRLEHKQLLVDPIPSGGGIINGGHRMFFDSKNQPIINYHKSDAAGNMQIYAARPGKKAWQSHVLTTWDKPVPFSGNGSMGFIGIKISGFTEAAPGLLAMTYQHKDHGNGRLIVDELSLLPVERKIPTLPDLPRQLNKPLSDFPGLGIQRSDSLGGCGDQTVRYMIQWESLGANRDRKPEGTIPPPSMLRLYKLTLAEGL